MGITWNQAFKMRGLLVLALLVSAAKAECPTFEPQECGPEEMKCGGDIDPWTGCPEPEWCMPSKGPMAKDGIMECTNFCPVKCDIDAVWCPAFVDEVTGCMTGESCWSQEDGCPN